MVDYTATKYFLVDVSNFDFQSIFAKHQFDVCINCSGAADVNDSVSHPSRDFELNTRNVFLLLNAIRQFNPKCRFIQISSAAVYGNPSTLPVRENSLLNPLSPYGFHKLMSENICREFYEMYNIQSCVLRIFSAYGIGLKKQLFWDLYQKFSNKNQIELFGTGDESRDFIYIDDINRCIELIILKSDFKLDIYNIANGIEIKISEIAETFASLLKSQKKIIFNNQVRIGNPLNWCADISRLEALGYKPIVNLENGLQQYIAWLNENGF